MMKIIAIAFASLSLLCSSAVIAQQNEWPLYDAYSLTDPGYMSLTSPSDFSRENHSANSYLRLAANEADADMSTGKSSAKEKKPEFSERWFTKNKFHQYLGLASLTMAVSAALAPKPPSDDRENGIHHDLAEASWILGSGAVATGLLFHYKDLSMKNATSNPDNMHALLATLGTIGYYMAASKAKDGAHAGFGIAGAVFMLGGIKITW